MTQAPRATVQLTVGLCVAESIALLHRPLADAKPQRPHRSVAHQPVG